MDTPTEWRCVPSLCKVHMNADAMTGLATGVYRDVSSPD